MISQLFMDNIKELTMQHLFLIEVVFTGIISLLLLNARFSFLPQDQGRAFAVNGQLSKGKIRGVGLIMVICFTISCLIFIKPDCEFIIYLVLLVLMMLSGYLDDASKIPWSDYKKGLIDFIISLVAVITFVMNNDTVIYIFGHSFDIPVVVYALLGIILIWVSVNVTNCSDGVDGLCGSLSVVTIFYIIVAYSENLEKYGTMGYMFIMVLLAYLCFNISPSTMLMGDAGSRAIGFFIAIIAMKSQHPICFVPFALMMIIDGGLGLVKVFLLRFLKIHILKNTRTPIHDHMRKNKGWSDTQVVYRFVFIQLVISTIFLLI